MASDEAIAEFIRTRIRHAREQMEMSQEELAKAIGKTNATISDIERGKVGVSAIDLAYIAKRLKKTLNYFFPFGAIVRVPKGELNTPETHLVSHFREIDSIEMQEHLIETAKMYADFTKKGKLGVMIDDAAIAAKAILGKDADDAQY